MAGSVEESRKILRQLSHQSTSSDGSDNAVAEELELLSNVYFDELEMARSESGAVVLNFHITPSTADDKDRQFVSLDLAITLPHKYPNARPEIHFSQSRGLSDAHLRGIAEGLGYKSTEYEGTPMVYELVEYAKDCLTDNNHPCGQCAVCQFEFEETDVFTKTVCYHYFHLPCLLQYVEFFRGQEEERSRSQEDMDLMLRKKPKQLECPVCREPIETDAACLEAIRGLSDSQSENTLEFEPSGALRAWQAEMAVLLRRQRERGGVIDLTQQDSVIDETWVSTGPRNKDSSEPIPETDSSNHTPGPNSKTQFQILQRKRDGERRVGERRTGERQEAERGVGGYMAGSGENVRTGRTKSGSKEKTYNRCSEGGSRVHSSPDQRNLKENVEHIREPLLASPSKLSLQDSHSSQQETGKGEEGGSGERERAGGGREVDRGRERAGDFRDGEHGRERRQRRGDDIRGPRRNRDFRGPRSDYSKPRPRRQWEGDRKREAGDRGEMKPRDQLQTGDPGSQKEVPASLEHCGGGGTQVAGRNGSSQFGQRSPQSPKTGEQFSNSRERKPETRRQGRFRRGKEDHSFSGGQRDRATSDYRDRATSSDQRDRATSSDHRDRATYHSSDHRDRATYHSSDHRDKATYHSSDHRDKATSSDHRDRATYHSSDHRDRATYHSSDHRDKATYHSSDHRDKATSSDHRDKATSSDHRDKATSSDHRDRATYHSSDHRDRATYHSSDHRVRATYHSSDHRDKATSSDHRDKATSSDHRDKATSSDHRDRATSSDHRVRATSSDHRDKAASSDHRDRGAYHSSDRRDKATSSDHNDRATYHSRVKVTSSDHRSRDGTTYHSRDRTTKSYQSRDEKYHHHSRGLHQESSRRSDRREETSTASQDEPKSGPSC